MDALQKWFQYQKRTSWILRSTYQKIPGKQAFSNYLQVCQNLPVAQPLSMTFQVFKTLHLDKAFVSHWLLMSYKNTSVTDAEIVQPLHDYFNT